LAQPAIAAKVRLSTIRCEATRTLDRQLVAANIAEESACRITVTARRQVTVECITVVLGHHLAASATAASRESAIAGSGSSIVRFLRHTAAALLHSSESLSGPGEHPE